MIMVRIPDKKKTTMTELMIENQWTCTSFIVKEEPSVKTGFASRGLSLTLFQVTKTNKYPVWFYLQ